MSSALELSDEVRASWSVFGAVPEEEMEYFTIGWGRRVKHLFVGIRPVDVDVDDDELLTEGTLHDIQPIAAAAYLGRYLMEFLKDLAYEEKMGCFTEPFLRSHVVTFLVTPTVWTDVLKPNLPEQCVKTLGHVVDYLSASEKLLHLAGEETLSLGKLSRSIKRNVA